MKSLTNFNIGPVMTRSIRRGIFPILAWLSVAVSHATVLNVNTNDGNYSPIAQVILTTNNVDITQLSSSTETNEVNIDLNLKSVDLEGGLSLIYWAKDGVDVLLQGFDTYQPTNTAATIGVGVLESDGSITNLTDSTTEEFRLAVLDTVTNPNLNNYIFYDGAYLPANAPDVPDFDVVFEVPFQTNDYLLVQERNGNTFFEVTPLNADGNAIAGANSLKFDKPYDWNTGYVNTEYYPDQPYHFTVTSVTNFFTGTTATPQPVYGIRIDNDGNADVKFIVLSDDPFPPGVSIGDYVWDDANRDGVQDGSESGISGVRVYIDLDASGDYNDGDLWAETAANGSYTIPNLVPGTYTVAIDTSTLPENYQVTFDRDTENNGTTQVTVESANLDDVDFGYAFAFDIGDYVWIDANNDGIQDAGEAAAAGVTVELKLGSTVIATETTDASGAYLFEGNFPGTYSVVVTDTADVLDGYSSTSAAGGGESQASPYTVILGNADVLTADFGYVTDEDAPFEVEKATGTVGFLSAGETNTYTITVTNTSPTSTQTQIEISDTLSDTLTYIPNSTVVAGYKMATFTNNTAGTTPWICPTGVTSIQVECWGGGGAGGAADAVDTANVGGGGGAGGAYASKASVAVTPGNSYDLIIPAAATAPVGAADGSRFNGAAVSFIGDSSVTVTAEGGQGGESRIGSGNISGTGGTGSVAGSVGDVVFAGGDGAQNGDRSGGGGGGGAGNANPGGNADNGTAGIGGLAGGGNGGAGRSGNGNGNSGNNPGGGGAGAKSQSSQGGDALYGGTGGLGQIVISYAVPDSGGAVTNDNITGGTYGDLKDGTPPNLVTTADGFVLEPGQSMTVTFDAEVKTDLSNDLISIPNTVGARSAEWPIWQYSSVTNAYELTLARLYGYAFWDKIENAVRDIQAEVGVGGDGAITNIAVQLWFGGAQIATTNTAANGYYNFPDLDPGVYEVRFLENPDYLVGLPVNMNPERNRASDTGESYAVVESYTLYAGHGIGTDVGEPVNAGFNGDSPTSSGIDLRAYQTAEGVVVEFVAYDVENDGSIKLVLLDANGDVIWTGYVDVMAGPRFFARFPVPGLELGQAYDFRMRDEVGNWWEADGVIVESFEAEMTSASLAGVTLSFDSLPDRAYEIQWTEQLGSLWQTVTNVPSQGDQTSVVVKYPETDAASGFFKIILK